MTHKAIKKIEVVYDFEKEGYFLRFDVDNEARTLQTQRKKNRYFKNLNQVASFFNDLENKAVLPLEMQEKELSMHLKHKPIHSIKIVENKEGYGLFFYFELGEKSMEISLITQKDEPRQFKSLTALISFIKAFFGEKVYQLKKIHFNTNVLKEDFESKGEVSAYDSLILKLANPNLKLLIN